MTILNETQGGEHFEVPVAPDVAVVGRRASEVVVAEQPLLESEERDMCS